MNLRRGIFRLFSLIFPMAATLIHGDTPFYDHSTTSRLGGRDNFMFNVHKAKLRSIKNRRRTGRR